MTYTASEVRAVILERVSQWKPRHFSWPHDTFMDMPWGYTIHDASVRAWNAEDRQTECVKFLLDWATEENVAKALKHGIEEGWIR